MRFRQLIFRRITSDKASILMLTLWILAILSLFALSLAYYARQEERFLSHLGAKSRIQAANEAGIYTVLDYLKRRDRRLPVGLKEALPGVIHPGGGQLGEIPYRLGFSGQYHVNTTKASQKSADLNLNDQNQARYVIMDHGQKLNLNSSDLFSLKRLLQYQAELDPKSAGLLAAAIVDYRDPDDDISQFIDRFGSEKTVYRAAGLDYGPKNDLFEHRSELLVLPGMTERIYALIQPYVTVYGEGKVNLNTAPAVILKAIDLVDPVVEKILRFRAGPDGTEGTADDQMFISLGEVESRLSTMFETTESEKASLRHLITRRRVDLGDRSFTIVSEARDRSVKGRTFCIFGVQQGIQQWIEA